MTGTIEVAEQKISNEVIELLLQAYFKEIAPERMRESVLYDEVPFGALNEIMLLKYICNLPL